MDTIELIARNGDAVRQAIERGEIVHLDTASEELTDEFLLFAIHSGLLTKWADPFPDPRQAAGIVSEAVVAPVQDHDLEVGRPMLRRAPALRAGDLLLADNGGRVSWFPNSNKNGKST
jgi:hypothetical protein